MPSLRDGDFFGSSSSNRKTRKGRVTLIDRFNMHAARTMKTNLARSMSSTSVDRREEDDVPLESLGTLAALIALEDALGKTAETKTNIPRLNLWDKLASRKLQTLEENLEFSDLKNEQPSDVNKTVDGSSGPAEERILPRMILNMPTPHPFDQNDFLMKIDRMLKAEKSASTKPTVDKTVSSRRPTPSFIAASFRLTSSCQSVALRNSLKFLDQLEMSRE